MARKTMEVMVDDIDGRTLLEGDGQTIPVVVGDERYQLDLSHEHVEELRRTIHSFLTRGQRRGDGVQFREPVAKDSAKPNIPWPRRQTQDLRQVREWARSRGFQVSERGRIPYHIMDAYTKAHLVPMQQQ